MKIILPLLLVLFLSACKDSSDNAAQMLDTPDKELLGKTVDEYKEIVKDQEPAKASASQEEASVTETGEPEIEKGFLPLKWEGLIAPGYDADSILAKYGDKINVLQEGSREARLLYEKMQAEYNEAPPNNALANKKVSIPGFIAPLEQSNGIITEFLLVPYFGACIHQPAPPANQTVHVKTPPDGGIRAEEAYDPIWVFGELLIDKSTTDIGTAGYKVNAAKIKKYDIDY